MLPTSDGVCSAAYPEKETAESASIAQLRLATAVRATSLLFSLGDPPASRCIHPNLRIHQLRGDIGAERGPRRFT